MVRALLGALESKAGIKVTVSHVDFVPSTGIETSSGGWQPSEKTPMLNPAAAPLVVRHERSKHCLVN